jgi:hypothetical protein
VSASTRAGGARYCGASAGRCSSCQLAGQMAQNRLWISAQQRAVGMDNSRRLWPGRQRRQGSGFKQADRGRRSTEMARQHRRRNVQYPSHVAKDRSQPFVSARRTRNDRAANLMTPGAEPFGSARATRATIVTHAKRCTFPTRSLIVRQIEALVKASSQSFFKVELA